MKLNEELGEVICPKCNGLGAILYHRLEYADQTCSKCNGKGKLDWIENIVGPVKPKLTFASFFSECAFNFEISKYQEEVIIKMAKKLQEEIDNEIIRSIMIPSEQNKNENVEEKNDN